MLDRHDKPSQWNGKRRSRHGKKSVGIHTGKCKACWKCISACPGGVLDKIDLPFHKHAHIKRDGECKGCLKCLKTCEFGAIYALSPASDAKRG